MNECALKFLVRINSTILIDLNLNDFIQTAIENGLTKKWHFDQVNVLETHIERAHEIGSMKMTECEGLFV